MGKPTIGIGSSPGDGTGDPARTAFSKTNEGLEHGFYDDEDGEIAALTEKAAPVDADLVVIEDSAASNAKKKAQIGNFRGLNQSEVDARVEAVVSGKQSVWVPVNEMFLGPFNNPGAQVFVGGGVGGAQFPARPMDPGSVEYMSFGWTVPASLKTDTPLSCRIYWSPTTTNTGSVRWELRAVALNDGDAIDQAQATGSFVDDPANGTVDDLHITSEASMSVISGIAANSLLNFRLQRTGNNASDTYTGDANLIGVMIHYTTDAPNDD